MTYKEALENGYKDAGFTYQRGYISRRKFDLATAECHEAGGRRKGQLYVLCPCYNSSKYCLRMYLAK